MSGESRAVQFSCPYIHCRSCEEEEYGKAPFSFRTIMTSGPRAKALKKRARIKEDAGRHALEDIEKRRKEREWPEEAAHQELALTRDLFVACTCEDRVKYVYT